MAELISSQDIRTLFPTKYGEYLKFLEHFSHSAVGDRGDAEKIYTFLTESPGKIDRTILDSLQQRSNRAKTEVNSTVQHARTVLHNFFRIHPLRQAAKDLGGDIILYGSLEFGDTVNTDADLLVGVKKTDHHGKVRQLIEDTLPYLEYQWQHEHIGGPPQLGLLSLEEALPTLERYAHDDDAEMFSMEAGNLSVAISGITLFPQTQSWFNHFQQDAIAIAESDPLVAAVVNLELANCLEIRRSREQTPS